MAYGYLRSWVEQLPVGVLFDLDDAQEAFPGKSRDAIKMALGRLCKGDDPLVVRATRGIYCRRRLGLRLKTPIPLEAKRALPWRIAGPGAAITGPDIINRIGWSTQVPPRLWIAVVGRPPRCPASGAVFVGRANRKRLGLGVWEASLLEAVRCFGEWSEMKWDDALDKYDRYMALGRYGDPVRIGPLLEAAEGERGLGPEFLPRCRELFAAGTKSPEAAIVA